MRPLYKLIILSLFLSFLTAENCVAQELLRRKVSISVSKKPVSAVLASIEKQGNLLFSYNSGLFDPDSLVTLGIDNKTIYSVLAAMFQNRFRYRQQRNYLIIVPVAIQPFFEIKGIIKDAASGNPVPYATVYERNQLVAAMSDAQGAFSITLKRRTGKDSLSVSRVSYADTTIMLGQTNDITIPLRVVDKELDSVVVSVMKRNWLSKQMLSSKQLMNSANLGSFFVKQPFQFSVLPGLGTHREMSSQLVNKFSLNLLGGYNGGVNGLELAGLYNITNKDARYVQVAGIFNKVNGQTEGVQLAGILNQDSLMKGFQVAGIMNKTKRAQGVQIAAYNKNDTMRGFQVAAVNWNHRFRGVQIGVVNKSDTMEGIPIGLINLGKKGLHQGSAAYNEMGFILFSYKSGNPRLYNILTAGSTFQPDEKAFSFGYGLGRRIKMFKAFSLNPEVSSLYFYNGNKNKQNIAVRLQANLDIKLSAHISISMGPGVTVLYSKPGTIPVGYKANLSNQSSTWLIAGNTMGWMGWSVGINVF